MLPAFTGAELDRANMLRHDPVQISRLLDEPASRAVAAGIDQVLLDGSDAPRLLRVEIDGDPADAILLGIEEGSALFARDLEQLDPEARERLTERGKLATLRDAGALLSRPEGGLAAYATALLNWHRRHRFCANCGAATNIAEGGYSRRCPRCHATHFPRTDPSVIMLVEHDRHVLLGRRPAWPESRYSVLAGFVSPGETLEEAVVREVEEESGIEAYDPRYVSSQPWPFPSSLMLGFEARADGGEPRVGDGELEDVRWFAIDEVREAQAGTGRIHLPPAISIARYLLDGWITRLRAEGDS
jgi:NAD+ diphosphatase